MDMSSREIAVTTLYPKHTETLAIRTPTMIAKINSLMTNYLIFGYVQSDTRCDIQLARERRDKYQADGLS